MCQQKQNKHARKDSHNLEHSAYFANLYHAHLTL